MPKDPQTALTALTSPTTRTIRRKPARAPSSFHRGPPTTPPPPLLQQQQQLAQGLDVLKEYPHIAAYVQAMEALPIWKATHYPDDMIVTSWANKLKAFSAT